MLAHIKINGIEYEEDTSSTILEVAKKHGVSITTLCYLKRHYDEGYCIENNPSNCRVCVVEIAGKEKLYPACSTYIEDGMEIFTNNKRVRSERKAIVELMISNHPNDCLACEKSGKCELQNLCIELGVQRYNFAGPLAQENKEVVCGPIKKNTSKCILCRRCTEVCSTIQGINAISAENRGFNTVISEPYDCVNCGQCVQVCPTGALLQVTDSRTVDNYLCDPSKYVVVHTAPSTRVALGDEFGFPKGTDVTGKMITALRVVGFRKVFDTNFTADLTIMEEAKELVNRLRNNGTLPMMTSCCPGWINFIELHYPEFIPNLSTCKSPQEMFGSVVKTYYAKKQGIEPKDIVVVSLMPCLAKKDELSRDELKIDGMNGTDFSMTTKEFAAMLKRFGIDLAKLNDGTFDNPLGESSGGADIFGNTGGVMEAALRTASKWINGTVPQKLDFNEVKGIVGAKEAHVKLTDSLTLDVCYVSGLKSARQVLDKIKTGELKYHFIEVMACPSGCINGGGQPIDYRDVHEEVIKARKETLKSIDKHKTVRASCDNESIKTLYNEFFVEPNSELAHHVLHTHYSDRKNK